MQNKCDSVVPTEMLWASFKKEKNMDKLAFAIESFKNIQDLIKFADQKAGAVLILTGLILSEYIQFLGTLTFCGLNHLTFLGILTFISSIIIFLCLLFVLYMTIFNVLKPKTAKHYQKEELSLFYYEHISRAGKDRINNEYEKIDKNIMLKNIIDQQYEISVILKRKTIALEKIFNWLFTTIISVIIFIFVSNQL